MDFSRNAGLLLQALLVSLLDCCGVSKQRQEAEGDLFFWLVVCLESHSLYSVLVKGLSTLSWSRSYFGIIRNDDTDRTQSFLLRPSLGIRSFPLAWLYPM